MPISRKLKKIKATKTKKKEPKAKDLIMSVNIWQKEITMKSWAL